MTVYAPDRPCARCHEGVRVKGSYCAECQRIKIREGARRQYQRKKEGVPERQCVVCEKPIPKERRVDAKTCGEACKKQYAIQKTKRWAEANPERKRAMNLRSNRRAAAEGRKARDQKAYAERHPDRIKAQVRRTHLARYGITPGQYDEMLAAQNGVCRLCERPCPSGKRLAVDHDHDTGVVRGLLCFPCNSAMAVVDANPGWIEAVQEYLRLETYAI